MNYEFTNRAKQISFGLMGIGLIAIVMGFMDDTHRAWANLLVNNFFFMALGLFGIFFIAMQYLSQAGYGVTMKRIPEAMSQYMWVAGPLMLVILGLGYHDIYHWTHAELHDPSSEHYDEIIANKGAYLNVPFFFIRAVVYIAVWIWAAHTLRKL